MIIKTATFICSNTKVSALPTANMPEYAFIGRSNVGKSSLINMLVNQHGLAKDALPQIVQMLQILGFLCGDEYMDHTNLNPKN